MNNHEPRCIHFPCTCVEILRQKVDELQGELRVADKYLFEASEKLNATYEELKSCRKRLEDGLSCCCSGCTRHNAFIVEEPKEKLRIGL